MALAVGVQLLVDPWLVAMPMTTQPDGFIQCGLQLHRWSMQWYKWPAVVDVGMMAVPIGGAVHLGPQLPWSSQLQDSRAVARRDMCFGLQPMWLC